MIILLYILAMPVFEMGSNSGSWHDSRNNPINIIIRTSLAKCVRIWKIEQDLPVLSNFSMFNSEPWAGVTACYLLR